jgi:hypothetical protein
MHDTLFAAKQNVYTAKQEITSTGHRWKTRWSHNYGVHTPQRNYLTQSKRKRKKAKKKEKHAPKSPGEIPHANVLPLAPEQQHHHLLLVEPAQPPHPALRVPFPPLHEHTCGVPSPLQLPHPHLLLRRAADRNCLSAGIHQDAGNGGGVAPQALAGGYAEAGGRGVD